MDAPVEEALPRTDTHIACYHHLLALVQAERFFEPAGASVEALYPTGTRVDAESITGCATEASGC